MLATFLHLALSVLTSVSCQDEVAQALAAVVEYNARLGETLGAAGAGGDRAIDGGDKDFSDVVLGMIESLQSIEDRGDEMVVKIEVQEGHLDTLAKEIKAKEDYIEAINKKIKVNEAQHSEMVAAISGMQEDKIQKEEEANGNKRKIKAQEVRLKRLLKDITTKVNYVQVIDSKVKEMEVMTRDAAKDMLEVQEQRDLMKKEVKELERSKIGLKQEIKNFTKTVEGRRQMKRDESLRFEREVKLYNETMEMMAEALDSYRAKIVDANSTLR